MSIYPHIINIESEGTYIVKLSTSKGNKSNITITVSDKAPAPEITGNVFQQNDERWGSTQYGYSDEDEKKIATIGSSGCGLLSLVNAIYKWKGIFICPKSLAKFSVDNGCRENGTGTIVTKLCKKYAETEEGKNINFTSSNVTYTNLDDLATHFKENKGVALGHMSRNGTGHWFAIVGYNAEKDEFLVYDSYANSFNGALGTTVEGDWCSREKLTANTKGNVGLNYYVLLYDGGAE